MKDNILIRPAWANETTEIVALIRASFSPELQNAMIYSVHGMELFIGRQINAPAGLSDTIYLVAIIDDLFMGCVEFRWLPDALFLNYICIHPKAKGKGLARRILKDSILIARGDHHRQMCLDVFENNLPASSWYERLGFRHDYSTQWWDIPIYGPTASGNGRISGYPHAMASMEQYGFSMFRLLTTEREYDIGCMGSDWFRVTQTEILTDQEALAMLSCIDKQRRILALIRDNNMRKPMPRDARLIVMSRRMSTDLERLLANLAD